MKNSEKNGPGMFFGVRLAVAMLLAFCSAPLPAAVIDADDPRYGEGSITRDFATGLDWLDLSLAMDRSFADVSAQFGEGGEFTGFRHAMGNEISELFTNAGIRGAADFDAGMQLQQLVGITSPGTSTTLSAGLYDDSATGVEPVQVGRGSLVTGTAMLGSPPMPQNFAGKIIEDDATPIDESEGLASHGHWLVRPTPPIATIKEIDDTIFGPGSITLDTNTGFEWLDLEISADRSFDDVSGQFGAGGDFEGFRHASGEEISALFENAGINGAADFDAGTAIQEMVGITTHGSPTVLSTGLYDDTASGFEVPLVGRAALATGTVMVGSPPMAQRFAGIIIEDDATPSDEIEGLTAHGHWLIRGYPNGGVAGDTNADGIVGIDDLNDVRNYFGAVGSADGSLDGDAFPFDGVVNIDDLNRVRNHFGAGANPVPEPSAILLAMAAVALGWSASPHLRRRF